jgi:hypothetical protein
MSDNGPTDQASPDRIREACERIRARADGRTDIYAGAANSIAAGAMLASDLALVLSTARAHAEMLERLRNPGVIMTAEPADSLIPPMTFMGIVVQINPALPPGHCQIIGPEGKLLATFQV